MLFLVLAFFSSIEITGSIVSSSDNQPVPYAFVQVIGKEELYTVADVAGEFSLKIPDITDEIQLNVRSIGYWEKAITLDGQNVSSLTIALEEKEFELKEVVVTDRRTESNIIGKPLSPTIDFGLASQDGGAVFFVKGQGILTHLHFHLSEVNGFPEAPMLINIYQADNAAKFRIWDEITIDSLQPLISSPILFENGKPGWNSLDLGAYAVGFNGPVIVHFLNVRKGDEFQWFKTILAGGRNVKLDFYGPSISYYKNIKEKRMSTLVRADASSPVRLRVNPMYRTNRFLYQLAIALEYETVK